MKVKANPLFSSAFSQASKDDRACMKQPETVRINKGQGFIRHRTVWLYRLIIQAYEARRYAFSQCKLANASAIQLELCEPEFGAHAV